MPRHTTPRMSHSLELTWHLIKRDFQLRYAGSVLGILWSLAAPISQLLILVFLLGLPILLGMALSQQLSISWLVVGILPLLLLIQAVLTTGLGLLIATANVFYRDVAQITHLALSLLFFLTPVFYQPPVDSAYRVLFEINPMSVVIQNYRKVLLDGTAPDWPSLALAFAMSLVIFLLGYWIHRRYESDVIDAI